MTRRRFRISPRAWRHIQRAEGWWIRNRDKAPEAFDEDLAEAFERITENPFVGRPVPSRTAGLRRVLLPRIRYFLYYRVSDDGAIDVVSLWHASRGSSPRL